MANKVAKRVVNKVAKRVVKRANKGYNKCCKDIIISGRRQMMNIGVETEKIEYKKTTGELKEGITSLASMLLAIKVITGMCVNIAYCKKRSTMVKNLEFPKNAV